MQSERKTRLFDPKKKMVVALDGPSASGKGYIGKEFARLYHLRYVESSRYYRGLAYLCLKYGILPGAIQGMLKLLELDLDEELAGIDLGFEEIGQMASKIGVVPEVRKCITKKLQEIVKQTPRILMEGRDIGSVVAPEADIKIFLTASVEERAERRYKQLINEGKKCMLSEVLNALRERDERDVNRPDSPLVATSDAIIIDGGGLSLQQTIEALLDAI